MAQGTTYSIINYEGELYNLTPEDTPFLSAIGGLQGGKRINSVFWTWQTETNRAADKYRQRLEGADAPAAAQRTRSVARNVVEIHQETVETSYTKQAAYGQVGSSGSSNNSTIAGTGSNPVLDEHAHQTMLAIKAKARDIEQGFVSGLYNEPTDNTTARRTRGIMQATATNVSDQGTIVGNGASTIATNGTITETSHGLSVGDIVTARSITGVGPLATLEDEQQYYVKTAPDADTLTLSATSGGATITFSTTGTVSLYEAAALTETMILDTMQLAWANGGLMESETRTIMCNAPLRRKLTKLFITDKGYIEGTRNVGGVSLSTIQTDFGNCNIILSRYVPTGCMMFVSLEECQPVFLDIPGKGHFFVEPLARTGAAVKDQLYGEVGLQYGSEIKHAKILGVKY